jgi:hypothetical protein
VKRRVWIVDLIREEEHYTRPPMVIGRHFGVKAENFRPYSDQGSTVVELWESAIQYWFDCFLIEDAV